MTRIFKSFHFDAAHWLPHVPEGHKCRRLHGHTYSMRVWCSGPLDARGFIADYAEITEAAKDVLDSLDHRCLNEIAGLENPTTEVLVRWVWNRLKPRLPQLSAVEIHESAAAGCSFFGDE